MSTTAISTYSRSPPPRPHAAHLPQRNPLRVPQAPAHPLILTLHHRLSRNVLSALRHRQPQPYGGNVHIAKYMLGGYACFGLIGAALFGIGVGLAAELAAGWLELKRASPMPAPPISSQSAPAPSPSASSSSPSLTVHRA